MRKKILETGLKLWRLDPSKVSARNIARRLNRTHSAVLYYFDGDLKERIAEYAVEVGDAKVIAQLIATGHPAIRSMDKKTRLDYMTKV